MEVTTRSQLMNKVESNKYPLISVLMSAHNTARFLPQAIESVLAETYSNFEFLIYDDASTDNSPEIIDQYARQDNRIQKYIGEQKAPSVSYILKFLISKSKGEYFTISDSDDICLPDRMQCLVSKAVKNPSSSIVFGWLRMVDEKCVKTLQIFGEPIWPFKYFLAGFVSPGASLISRKYYNMTDGFDDKIYWSADRDLYLQMLEKSYFSYIGRVVHIYRRHMTSLTFKRPDSYDALAIIREKTVKRNIPIVQRYLEKEKTDITYNEYVALTYVMAYLAIEILGQHQNDPVIFSRLAKKLGVNYQSFLKLKHNVSLTGIENIDQLRNLIAKQIKKTESDYVTLLLQFYYKTRQFVFGKARRVLSILFDK
jgi:glycosyltransferase involved in cell wall biosynthesis